MTPYSPYQKGTVLAPVGGVNHLHVVCNNPVYYAINGCDCVLVVNITSIYSTVPYDDSCILNVGDHAFIKHPSYVFYGDAIIWKVQNIISKIQSGNIIPHKDMSPATFQRILDGFDISDQISRVNWKFYKNYC